MAKGVLSPCLLTEPCVPWLPRVVTDIQILITSVVQRQLWLLNNVPDMTKSAAYDIARREFYKIRLQEDIERRVAAEEAEATGATFGPSTLEIGMELENQQHEKWKAWAKTEAQLFDQRTASLTGAPEIASETEPEADSLAIEESSTPLVQA